MGHQTQEQPSNKESNGHCKHSNEKMEEQASEIAVNSAATIAQQETIENLRTKIAEQEQKMQAMNAVLRNQPTQQAIAPPAAPAAQPVLPNNQLQQLVQLLQQQQQQQQQQPPPNNIGTRTKRLEEVLINGRKIGNNLVNGQQLRQQFPNSQVYCSKCGYDLSPNHFKFRALIFFL